MREEKLKLQIVVFEFSFKIGKKGVNMQVISLTSKIMMIISIETKERRKWHREVFFHMEKYELSSVILVGIKNIK